MSRPVSTARWFWPDIPPWTDIQIQYRTEELSWAYYDLAEEIAASGVNMANFPNISVEQANQYGANCDPPTGNVSGALLQAQTDTGRYWIYSGLPLTVHPPQPPDYPFDWWDAMCTGLTAWQMLTIMQQIQVWRLTTHRYGRKPKKV